MFLNLWEFSNKKYVFLFSFSNFRIVKKKSTFGKLYLLILNAAEDCEEAIMNDLKLE